MFCLVRTRASVRASWNTVNTIAAWKVFDGFLTMQYMIEKWTHHTFGIKRSRSRWNNACCKQHYGRRHRVLDAHHRVRVSYTFVEFVTHRNSRKVVLMTQFSHFVILWPFSDLFTMTLTSDQLKTVIIELGAPENLIIETKIIKLTCLWTEI